MFLPFQSGQFPTSFSYFLYLQQFTVNNSSIILPITGNKPGDFCVRSHRSTNRATSTGCSLYLVYLYNRQFKKFTSFWRGNIINKSLYLNPLEVTVGINIVRRRHSPEWSEPQTQKILFLNGKGFAKKEDYRLLLNLISSRKPHTFFCFKMRQNKLGRRDFVHRMF